MLRIKVAPRKILIPSLTKINLSRAVFFLLPTFPGKERKAYVPVHPHP